MRYYILLLITLFFPVCIWGQFNPSNPEEPSKDRPYADFNYEVYKSGVVFTNESSRASRYEWNFGDGTTSTEKNPEHVYAQPGTYTVTLKATNGIGDHTRQYYINIDANYTIFGNFTLDPSKTGIRNFQSLDAMFQDLLDLPISGDITITAAQGLELRLTQLNILDIIDPLTEKLVQSTYKIRLNKKDGSSTYLYLWDEFNKDNYEKLEKLAEHLDCSLYICLGEYRFYMSARSYLFRAQTICYGRSSDQIWFDNYSNIFTYEWKLTETPNGLSGYEESGTNKIPPMSVTNTTDKYQPLKYKVLFKYNGETYASDIVTFWVYPQTPYLNLSEPANDGLIATPDDVNLSWEPIPGNISSYTVYMRKNGESEFQSKAWTNNNECHINNDYNNYFEYDQSYEWYVETYNRCNGSQIRSETRTFTIGSAADLEITDIKAEPQTAISGKDFKITATIANTGTKDIESESWTDVIRSTNNSLSSQSRNHSGKSLAVGESYEISFTLTAPYNEELESLKFELETGRETSLRELSKNNNRKEIEIPLALLSIPEDEYQVLCALYNQADGANWNLDRRWDITTNAVDKNGWEGVTLDDDGHIIKIDLSQRGLAGTIPPGLFSLPYLQELDLSNNTLTGKLEEAIPEGSNATKLSIVNLGKNQFSGTIPASINQLPLLTRLDLYSNQLEAVEEMLSPNIDLYITSQKLTTQEIKLLSRFTLDIPSICLYNHEDRKLEEYPEFSLSVPGSSTTMHLDYNTDDNAYRIRWDNYNHYINLNTEQDLTLTQTSGSARDSKATVRLVFPQGDANMDAAVDVKDVGHTRNFITNDNNSGGESGYIDFNYYAANTYQDEQAETTINVQDLVATVNIILDASQTMSASALRSSESSVPAAFLSVEDGKLVIDNPVEPVMDLDIILKNVTSKQLELLLPTDNYLYMIRDIEGGVRFILVWMNGPGIPLGKTSIMKVNGSGASVAHALLTNKAADEVPSDFEGKALPPTGNESLNTEGISEGILYIDKEVKAISTSIYDMRGHIISSTRIKEVTPGHYEIRQWLPQQLTAGVYLIYVELHTSNEIKHQTIKVSLTK